MSETPDEPEDQASGQPQPDEEERPQRRKVTEDELKEILEAHDAWWRSDGARFILALITRHEADSGPRLAPNPLMM